MARKRLMLVVENGQEIINFRLQRGDTVHNMEDSVEYVHTGYNKPVGVTHAHLISNGGTKTVESADDINEDEVVVDEVEEEAILEEEFPDAEPEVVAEEEVIEEKPAPKKRASKTKTKKDA